MGIVIHRPQRRFSFVRAGFAASTTTGALGVRELYACTDTSAPRTLTISSAQIAASVDSEIFLFTVIDESLGANANNITIDTEGAELIGGASSIVITENGGSVTLYASGGNLFNRD